MVHLSDNLRKLRYLTGLTQSDMGDVIGLSVKTYAKYEEGRNECSFNTLIKLSEFYNIKIDKLLKQKL